MEKIYNDRNTLKQVCNLLIQMASTHTYKSIMHYLSEMQCGHTCDCQVFHITSSSARAQWPGAVTGPRFVRLDCVVGPPLALALALLLSPETEGEGGRVILVAKAPLLRN